MEIRQIVKETRAYSCLDCGKCTVACPVARYDPAFSPRKLVQAAAWHSAELAGDRMLWSCVTCSMCEERCQSGVQYTALVRALRDRVYAMGERGEETHGGALEAMMNIMAGSLKQGRPRRQYGRLRTVPQSDTVYFAGCQPYFDVIFADLGVKTTGIGQGTVKLLNAIGVVPALLDNERCCGHDRLWAGDTASFRKLAERNLDELSRIKAKRIITSCPECYHTLKVDYPRFFGSTGFEVVHITQLLVGEIGKLSFRRLPKKVTYHDSCRLGRFSGICDEPRQLLGAIPGIELIEMERRRQSALCCGTQAWISCGATNKKIQQELLDEAAATGAELLVTSCPKCQIHLRCAQNGNGAREPLPVEDLTSLAARALAAQEVSP